MSALIYLISSKKFQGQLAGWTVFTSITESEVKNWETSSKGYDQSLF